MTVVYKEGRDMVIPDALLRLRRKLYSQKGPIALEEQAFISIVLLSLNDAEVNRF